MTPDPVCNGKGYLWQTALNQMTMLCWRCAGTGFVPELVPPKERGPMPFKESNKLDQPAEWGSEDESTQDA